MKTLKNLTKIFLKQLNRTKFQPEVLSTILPTTEDSLTTSLLNMTTIKTSEAIKANVTQQNMIDHISNFFLSTEYCHEVEPKHPSAYCNYMATCIFIGYVLRLFIMPFVILRIERLGRNIRSEYNFSLTWLFLVATIPYVDVVEYLTTGNPQAYSRFINIINFIHFVFTVHAIVRYIYYYGFDKSNFKNLSIAIIFIFVWISIAVAHLAGLNTSKTRNEPLSAPTFVYCLLFLLFAVIQVFKNVINETGRCLTHASFGFWLSSAFFMTSYPNIVPSDYFKFIYYRNFFEITTLVTILLQNIVYGDKKASHELIPPNPGEENYGKEMRSTSKSNNNTIHRQDSTNSAVDYFRDEDNAINMDKLYKSTTKPLDGTIIATGAEEDTYFDKNQLIKKLDNKGNKILSFFKPKSDTVKENDEFDDNQTEVSYNQTHVQDIKFRTNPDRNKAGIFLSFWNNRTWLMILVIFCTLYYVFSSATLIKSLKGEAFSFLCPFVHPITIGVAVFYKKFIRK